MKHKTLVGRIFAWIGDLFHKAESELVPVILPFIGHLLNTIKTVVESPLVTAVFQFFHITLPPELFEKVKTALQKVIEEFGLVVDLSKATTQEEVNAALQKVFADVKWPDDVQKQKFLSSFGARVLQEIKDHEMTFAQAVIDVEYFWENYINNPPVAAAA